MKIFTILLCFYFVKCQECPEKFEAPENCFEIEEILDYVEAARKLQQTNEEYLNLLTEAGFVVDETEVRKFLTKKNSF